MEMNKETHPSGRPRSEQARAAVLNAADDLLVEIGYAAMTMKGIAEKARVSRQTIYRWWSHKAEILFEASAADAEEELSIQLSGDPLADLTAYLEALIHFLANSPAGAAYRALLGEAQQDSAVAELLSAKDPIGDTAQVILKHLFEKNQVPIPLDQATALFIGPCFFWILSGRDPAGLVPQELAKNFLSYLQT
ncbi:MAG: TetR/AcrR family transcriptional regulator [Paenibacillus sp.]|jgi:AcrR family transcriptional regulator|uniref:TetR/AcrR family transcriptional regulator n=2 Tax=Paenibacillus TaxID=44249 RepID=UPI000B2A0542|nr:MULTISPECIES: TetR/AcrR family transcriptional regulator [unclassified Paenibacillus]MDU4694461.1 TetR/AcrR family transcriptional regulator [Paenibacillus sp.]